MRIIDIPTPALMVEESVFTENLQRMAQLCGKKLRPHFKSHKCPEIARLQMEQGAKGLCCATIREAEILADTGIPDILFANQIADAAKADRLAQVAVRTKLTVCAEKQEEIDLYAAAAQKHGVQIGVYAEYDTGMNRMGVGTAEEVLALAKMAEAAEELHFAGVQAYAGHLSHIPSIEERCQGARELEAKVIEIRTLLERHGFHDFAISGGSTGTAACKIAGGVYTEIQAGSYLLGDNNYELCGLPFGQSLYILATVMGAHGQRIITDAGVKAAAVDQGLPALLGFPVQSLELHEEHGLIELADGVIPPQFGARVRYVPGHCCATMNMHDRVYFVDGDEVTRVVEIAARGH